MWMGVDVGACISGVGTVFVSTNIIISVHVSASPIPPVLSDTLSIYLPSFAPASALNHALNRSD